jgi:hypothetical protein
MELHSGILSNCKELNLVENADDLVVLDVVLEVPAQECVLSIRTKTEAAFITAILNLATSSDDCCKKNVMRLLQQWCALLQL